MEIYDEMIKNMAFGKNNKRVFRMDTRDVPSPNKRYMKETQSKRTRSLPIRNSAVEDVIQKTEEEGTNRDIDGSNITFYGQS